MLADAEMAGDEEEDGGSDEEGRGRAIGKKRKTAARIQDL